MTALQRLCRLLAGVLLAALLVPAGAGAHARLQSAAPADGADLPSAPPRAEFDFDEPVLIQADGVRVLDARGHIVSRGAALHPDGDSSRIAVELRPGLPAGSYAATYRVVSADGHPVAGGTTFGIRTAPAGAASQLERFTAEARTGRVTSSAQALARALQYGAIAAAFGLWLLLATAGELPRRVDDRARWALQWTAVVGAWSAALLVALQGAIVEGTSLWGALDATTVRTTLSTQVGAVWTAAAVLWAITAAATATRRIPFQVAGVTTVLLVAAPAFGGHPDHLQPRDLVVGLNVAHVLVAGAWLGGLLALVVVLAPALRGGALVPHLRRFSRMALAAVTVLTATGAAQASFELTSVRDLWATAFGRALAAKVLLLLGAIALAACNHRAVAARAALDAEPVLRRVRAELSLLAAVLVATGLLAGYAPPTQLPPEPVHVVAGLGARGQVTVDLAQPVAGGGRLAVLLTDRATGRPLAATKQLTLEATLPARRLGPLTIALRRSGAGRWTSTGAPFPVAGDWRLHVTNRTSDFDQDETTVPLRIARPR